MMMGIRRLDARDGKLLNAFANHPSIRPWLGGVVDGPLDWSIFLDDHNVYAFYGEHGGILCIPVMPGLYDCHMQVLPEGRGRWAVNLANEVFYRMFAQTDAMELVARIPEYNKAARGMMRLIGAHHECDQESGWVRNGEPVNVSWYSLTIHDWIRKDPHIRQVNICLGGHKGKTHVFGKRLSLLKARVGGV